MKLEGKVAIVTGGASGIGKAFAIRLAADGASVVIADLQQYDVAAAALASSGARALGLKVDVSSETDTSSMAEETLKAFGRIDILVNNAAMFSTIKVRPFEEIPVDEWKRLMEVNIMGVALCCKAVAPQMRRQKGGRIVNLASGAPLKGVPFFLHYIASKGAVIAMTRGLARELGKDNITVNAIAPGLTLSEGVLSHPEHLRLHQESIRSRAIQREQHPIDLVGAVSFLAGDDSAFMSGQTLVVDGGSAML
jgi:NAD(P)-dependent dehydrogenase (short-subunit alcohol dehydrogenase family)